MLGYETSSNLYEQRWRENSCTWWCMSEYKQFPGYKYRIWRHYVLPWVQLMQMQVSKLRSPNRLWSTKDWNLKILKHFLKPGSCRQWEEQDRVIVWRAWYGTLQKFLWHAGRRSMITFPWTGHWGKASQGSPGKSTRTRKLLPFMQKHTSTRMVLMRPEWNKEVLKPLVSWSLPCFSQHWHGQASMEPLIEVGRWRNRTITPLNNPVYFDLLRCQFI